MVFRKLTDWFHYDQEKVKFVFAGIESGSSVINISGMLAIFMLGMLMHIMVMFLHSLLKKFFGSKNFVTRCLLWIMRGFTFGFYLSLILEGYTNTMLSSFSEVYQYDLLRVNHNVPSYVCSIVILSL